MTYNWERPPTKLERHRKLVLIGGAVAAVAIGLFAMGLSPI